MTGITNYNQKSYVITSLCVLVAILFLSCSVKEDRDDCPCWLTVVLDDAARTSNVAGVVMWDNEGETILLETASPFDYFERAVPKGLVRTSVSTGTTMESVNGPIVKFIKDTPVDSLWVHTTIVNCEGEYATCVAELHRQFAVAKFFLNTGAQTEDDMRTFQIETSCGGFDIRSLQPVSGQWSLPLDLTDPDGCKVIVPRMNEDTRFSIIIAMPNGDVDEVDLQEILRKNGYDWTKADLDDMVIKIDRGISDVTVLIVPWNDGGDIDEII